VAGDRGTVFGELPGQESEQLPAEFRSHGSLHEQKVPLFAHNNVEHPCRHTPTSNKDLLTPPLNGWLNPTA
jgi:phosphonoacetate hydrolase